MLSKLSRQTIGKVLILLTVFSAGALIGCGPGNTNSEVKANDDEMALLGTTEMGKITIYHYYNKKNNEDVYLSYNSNNGQTSIACVRI